MHETRNRMNGLFRLKAGIMLGHDPIKATQWFKNGDHPEDGDERFPPKVSPPNPYVTRPSDANGSASDPRYTGEFAGELYEGKVVRYFRRPDVSGETICRSCRETMHVHGWIDAGGDGHVVCPGDWIIKDIAGEFYPCKPEIFDLTYEPFVRNRELENLTAENATLKEHLHEVTKALLAAIEEIRGWHGQSHWKLYYETWETMKPIREVLERPDSVGTYSAEDGYALVDICLPMTVLGLMLFDGFMWHAVSDLIATLHYDVAAVIAAAVGF